MTAKLDTLKPAGLVTMSGPSGRSSRLVRIAIVTTLFVVMALLFVWPLVMLTIGAFRSSAPGLEGGWTLHAFIDILTSKKIAASLGATFALTLATTTFATLIAAILAYLSERTDAPFRQIITPAMAVLFATPGVFYAVGFSQLANPYTGYLNVFAKSFLGLDTALFNIESWIGLGCVMTLRKAAFFYLFLLGPFRALNSAYEDVSLIAGRSRLYTFFHITLPVLAPAVAGVILMGVANGLHAFDIPL
ncbi:MAG: hypothetical protein ABW199_03535, partial [Caulobacterales bacterium]